MTNMTYTTLSPILYIRPVHHGILLIPNNATRIVSCKIKQLYDDNIRVFHEVRGVEQALIQKVVKSVDKQYIIYMKNRTTGQFRGNIRQIFAYLL